MPNRLLLRRFATASHVQPRGHGQGPPRTVSILFCGGAGHPQPPSRGAEVSATIIEWGRHGVGQRIQIAYPRLPDPKGGGFIRLKDTRAPLYCTLRIDGRCRQLPTYSMSKMEVHVVSKTDNNRHSSFTIDSNSTSSSAAEQLEPSCVRARPFLLSLSSNNLSYARGGHALHWFVRN